MLLGQKEETIWNCKCQKKQRLQNALYASVSENQEEVTENTEKPQPKPKPQTKPKLTEPLSSQTLRFFASCKEKHVPPPYQQEASVGTDKQQMNHYLLKSRVAKLMAVEATVQAVR